MYRIKTITFINTLLAVSLLMVTSCMDPSIEDELDERPIRLAANRSFDATRAVTTNIQGAVFDAGEQINVWITGESNDVTTTTQIGDFPCVFTTGTASGGSNALTIAADKQPYYHYGKNSVAHIYAAYPANNDVNVTPAMTTFTVQSDQRTVQAYKNSDLMMVPPFDHNKTADIVSLPFKHKMAKLIVTAIADDGVTVDGELTIGGVKRSVDIDVASGDFTSTYHVFDETEGSTTGERSEILMLNGGAVLFPPQEVTAVRFITVTGTKDGVAQAAQFNIMEKTFQEGRVYKLNLHIGKDDFTPNADGSPHVSTITGWSSDFDELTVTPSGGYAGVQIATIDGVVSTMDQTVTADDLEDGCYVHNGTARCPKPAVTYGTTDPVRLIEGADFRFAYIDNVNSGTAIAMVIGQGSYAGLAAMQEFTIKRAKGRIYFDEGSDKTGENAVAFNPDENIGAVVARNTGDGDILYSVIADGDDESTDCASVDPIDGTVIIQNVGKCTILATASSGRNYDYVSPNNTCKYKIHINPKEVKVGNLTVTYAPTEFTFDDTDKKLTSLVVADGEHTLVEDVDYTYTFTNNRHHGDAKLTITGKGNYNESTKIEIAIPINQAKPTITVKETELALGVQTSTAPKTRKKTREATTQDWAASKIRFSLSPTSDVKSNEYVSVNNNGLLTGLKAHPEGGKTTVYVSIVADDSEHHDWVAAEQKSFDVKVYQSDFTFRIKRYSYSDYREPQLHILSDGTPEGAHTEWICPAKGEWQIDCYGAQGGSTPKHTTERTGHRRTSSDWGAAIVAEDAANGYGIYTNQGTGGRGAHIAGRIYLTKNMKLHVNLGQKGRSIYPGEQRLRGTAAEICTVVDQATAYANATGRTPNGNKVNRGKNGGKKNGDLSFIKAGDYEWAAFAWNGGGGMVWGAHNMEHYPELYVQDNWFLGNGAGTGRSVVAVGPDADVAKTGNSYAMFPVTGGGGATDVSLAWDEEGGVYTPPELFVDADRTSNINYSYIDNSNTNGSRTFSFESISPRYTRANGGTFEKWMAAHNMVNREYGVGVQGDDQYKVGLKWKNPAHLFSRIIVAAGGGGALYYDSSNTFGDGGDGGAWEGTRGLFQDYGEGGYINAAGRGGIWQNWKMGSSNSRTNGDDRTDEYTCTGLATNYPSDMVYSDGPLGGGWSGTDGMFGEGGNTFQPGQGCGGGGGGWYGGGAGCEDGSNGPGGGGSSFIWTDQESVRTYVSSQRTQRSNFDINHSVTFGPPKLMYKFYNTIDADYLNYNGFYPEVWHKKAANFYKFMPTNSTVKAEKNQSDGRKSELGIECPFFHQIVTKDAGANAGDGWAKITLVEIDDEQ